MSFFIRQLSSVFVKDGRTYRLQVKDLRNQARKAAIDYRAEKAVSFRSLEN